VAINLHSAVRPAINAVNPDISCQYLRSTGYTVDAAGKQIPAYAPARTIRAQVQPPSGKTLQHPNNLNIQGTIRSVYLYGEPQAIVRVDGKGGDLLQFPQYPGAPVDNWLLTMLEEAYDPLRGWSKVTVTLQTDRPAP
jgi:hypothetical protein